MRGMKTWLALSLTALLWPIAATAADDTVTVHRCVDGKGRVTLQDNACPAGSHDNTRTMQRPKDPAPRPAPAAAPPVEPAPAPSPPYDYEPGYALIPPPPMFRCTSYDGIVRESESYDPNPRCEPLGLYYPPGQLTGEQARACRWVEDSCVRLDNEATCTVWRKRHAEAKSKALHAFSNSAAYWKSELARISQILGESCP